MSFYNPNETYPSDSGFWGTIYPQIKGPNDATNYYSTNLINWAWNKSKYKMERLSKITREKCMKMWGIAFHNGYLVNVFSGYRSFDKQKELYDAYHRDPVNNNIAAPPGRSYHNYGMAWDCMVMKHDGSGAMPGGSLKLENINIKAGLNLKWGGYFSQKDPYHFSDPRMSIDDLQKGDDYQTWLENQSTKEEIEATEAALEEYKDIQVSRAKHNAKAWFKKNIYWLIPIILGSALGLLYLGILAWKRSQK